MTFQLLQSKPWKVKRVGIWGDGLEFHYQLHGLDSTATLPKYVNQSPLKEAKCRLVMTSWNTADDWIAIAGIQERTGRKWLAKSSVGQEESMLYLWDIIGNTSTERQGVGMSHFQQRSKVSAAMVKAEVRRTEDQCILVKIYLENTLESGWSGTYQSGC